MGAAPLVVLQGVLVAGRQSTLELGLAAECKAAPLDVVQVDSLVALLDDVLVDD